MLVSTDVTKTEYMEDQFSSNDLFPLFTNNSAIFVNTIASNHLNTLEILIMSWLLNDPKRVQTTISQWKSTIN